MFKSKLSSLAAAALAITMPAAGQDAGTVSAEDLGSLYPGETYSPYANRSFPSNIYWGETHVHTGLSLDAGLFGNVLGHADAYRFARGEQITASSGLPENLAVRSTGWSSQTIPT